MANDIEQIWNEFWKPILVKKDGEIDLEQLKKELFDYHVIMGEVSKVYCHITNGQVSKPNTQAEVVIAMNDDIVTQSYENGLADADQDAAY